VMQCAECGERLHLDEVTYHLGPGSVAAPGTKLLQHHLEPPLH